MKFDIRGMRMRGMNDRQIDRYIKKAEKELRERFKPKNFLTGVSGDQVKGSNMGLGSSPSYDDYLKTVPQGGMGAPSAPTFVGAMKKGGGAKNYEKGGKINLDACSVSTASKSKKSPNW